MEPQAPQNSPQESQPIRPVDTPPKKKISRKTLIILIVCGVLFLLVLLICGVRAILTVGESKNTASSSLDNSLYHMRDGYDIKKYGSTIGDPLALSMNKQDKPFSTKVGPIVYACNVISVRDLTAQKTYLEARQDPQAVTRTFIDGVGKQSTEMNEYSLPTSGKDDNNCTYGLQSGGLLSISVYQPPFTTKDAVVDTISRLYTKSDSVGGLDTYKYKRGEDSLSMYMLVSGNDAMEVTFNGTKLKQGDKDKLLALAAKNMVQQQKTPQGPAIAAYDTPTYKKSYAKACDFISNDDIKTLTGADASIYATEGLASGTGVLKADGKLYNSISTSCSRANTGLGSGLTAGAFDQELEVTMTSFSDSAAAKFVMESTGKDVQDKTQVVIGDDAFGYRDSVGQNTIFFRQGRFIVELVFDRTVQDNAGLQDTAAMAQKLTPYGQQVAAKLKSMQ